ncbi:DegV family protein [Listeria ivanovii]|uniref:DegV family protein n=2 Tax=Listeria ivanovii TaxID=1638 RepID=A0ABS1G5W8_LISIV|nr:DegV family protein [Listeria ivanovii]EFR95837.1 DegV family protein [Listeria ivanovii FSL F6-596]AIS60831.1 DegV domain-containing protein [Listeria ivanovii subsp. londoniensis]AIS63657.1 DegV domain-containing protein [Listeria ivanovii subsp. londoniensis]MBK1962265.1 DegV family protein [Listeria ivanovii subsp. londoniensis]MBK1967181.1 DegV family protein [Listeria ivanovii subsp. londoniensis]
MNGKIAVVTDSTTYLPEEAKKQLRIHVVPLSVIIDGESYREGEDLSTADFYAMVKVSKNLPTSSQPAPGEFIQLFEKLKSQGFDTVITIHLSSGISGTFQNAATAGEGINGLNVIAYDSELSCMAQGMLVLKAAEMALKDESAENIIKELDKIKHAQDAYFMVDDLNNLQRGGRLNGAQALVGSLLQIKPILHFNDKQIVLFEKVRTQKKALKRIEDILELAIQNKFAEKAYVIHGNDFEKGEAWRKHLETKFPEVEFELSYFGPVIGTHLGEGALGLTWSIK